MLLCGLWWLHRCITKCKFARAFLEFNIWTLLILQEWKRRKQLKSPATRIPFIMRIPTRILLILFSSGQKKQTTELLKNLVTLWVLEVVFDRSTCSKQSKESLCRLKTFFVPFSKILEYFVIWCNNSYHIESKQV